MSFETSANYLQSDWKTNINETKEVLSRSLTSIEKCMNYFYCLADISTLNNYGYIMYPISKVLIPQSDDLKDICIRIMLLLSYNGMPNLIIFSRGE